MRSYFYFVLLLALFVNSALARAQLDLAQLIHLRRFGSYRNDPTIDSEPEVVEAQDTSRAGAVPEDGKNPVPKFSFWHRNFATIFDGTLDFNETDCMDGIDIAKIQGKYLTPKEKLAKLKKTCKRSAGLACVTKFRAKKPGKEQNSRRRRQADGIRGPTNDTGYGNYTGSSSLSAAKESDNAGAKETRCLCSVAFGLYAVYDKNTKKCHIPVGKGYASECTAFSNYDPGLPQPAGDPTRFFNWNRFRPTCVPNAECVEGIYYFGRRCQCFRNATIKRATGECNGVGILKHSFLFICFYFTILYSLKYIIIFYNSINA